MKNYLLILLIKHHGAYRIFFVMYCVMKGMKIKPIHSNVVIKPAKKAEMTKSGIVLPGTVDQERPEKGEVIAVGDGKMLNDGTRAPMTVKVGDTVMFKKYSPDEIKIDGEEYLVITEEDIIGIITS